MVIIDSIKGKWLVRSGVAKSTGTMSTYKQEGVVKYAYNALFGEEWWASWPSLITYSDLKFKIIKTEKSS